MESGGAWQYLACSQAGRAKPSHHPEAMIDRARWCVRAGAGGRGHHHLHPAGRDYAKQRPGADELNLSYCGHGCREGACSSSDCRTCTCFSPRDTHAAHPRVPANGLATPQIAIRIQCSLSPPLLSSPLALPCTAIAFLPFATTSPACLPPHCTPSPFASVRYSLGFLPCSPRLASHASRDLRLIQSPLAGVEGFCWNMRLGGEQGV